LSSPKRRFLLWGTSNLINQWVSVTIAIAREDYHPFPRSAKEVLGS